VRIQAIGLRESWELPFAASIHSVEGSGPPLANEFSDCLVRSANIERLSNLFEVAKGLSRDSHGRFLARHLEIACALAR